jgi:hypothetical protein
MKFIINESQYKRLLSEQSEAEARIKNVYKLMIKGSEGLGSEPNLIVNGINSLTSDDEFYRLNTMFKDKKTGYSSFDEMINGEFEYSKSKKIDNEPQFNSIIYKLSFLGVDYGITYSKTLHWPILKINNPKNINFLSDLPKEPKPVSTSNSISPSNVKISGKCMSAYNRSLSKAKKWLNDWLSSDITKQKFINNYKGIKTFSPQDVKHIFDNYKMIIDRTPLRFYNGKVNVIDGIELDNHYKFNIGGFANDNTQKIYANCHHDLFPDDWPFQLLIHEIQHILYDYFPINPDQKVNKVFSIPTNSKSNKSNKSNESPQVNNATKNEFGLNMNWLTDYCKKTDKNSGPEYTCESTEKQSNLYAIRAFFGLKPHQSLKKEMFLPYMESHTNTDIALLLCCWQKKGYPDFNTFLNGLNSLAFEYQNKNNTQV